MSLLSSPLPLLTGTRLMRGTWEQELMPVKLNKCVCECNRQHLQMLHDLQVPSAEISLISLCYTTAHTHKAECFKSRIWNTTLANVHQVNQLKKCMWSHAFFSCLQMWFEWSNHKAVWTPFTPVYNIVHLWSDYLRQMLIPGVTHTPKSYSWHQTPNGHIQPNPTQQQKP